MVSTEEPDSQAYKDFQYLISKLNLDESTSSQAWENYKQISSKFTLEGTQLHWLGCAIFVASRTSTTLSVSRSVLESNCINLTSLLRHSDLSILQFFTKITSWAQMTKMPEEFNKKITALHSKVVVSFNIFKNFGPLFLKIFNAPTDPDSNQHRNRKQKPLPCTSMRVFEFCWLMFITAKGEDDCFSEDLVSSCHLLYACCDLAFKNIFLEDRRDLLNPKFSVLPEDWTNPDYSLPTEAPCSIAALCLPKDNSLTNAKYMKEYKFKMIVKSWFDKSTLLGDRDNYTGIFNSAVFDINYKNLTKTYEALFLNKGDFDERIFLAEYRRQLIIKEQSINNNISTIEAETRENSSTESPSVTVSNESEKRTPNTPLTGRKYLGPKESNDDNASSQSIGKLQQLAAGRGPFPSEALRKIFRLCAEDPYYLIKDIISELREKYVTKYCQKCNIEKAELDKKLHLTTTLCYKFLENILKNERSKQKDISLLIKKIIFFKCLFACSLEIVEHSYNSQKKFPWIVNILEISVFDFVKVIELVVRFGDTLPRETIKHLNWIEERILESLLWKADSVIWPAIEKEGDVPKFEETALPGNMVYSNTRTNVTNPLQSPGPSAVDTFQSPVMSNQVKKNLFPPMIKPGQTVFHGKPFTLVITDSDGNKKLVRLVETSAVEHLNLSLIQPTQEVKSKKSGGLAIIFRKFYNLAGVRMDHLCQLLSINTLEMKHKIWTIFEYSITSTDLIKDRHLDQLLMCAVYVLCKVTANIEKSFLDIMRCYRQQPQANNYIYRHVLIAKQISGENNENQQPEKRDDLISFYNNIYVVKMEKFALKFSSNCTQSKDVPLSPLPTVKPISVSPKTEIQKNVYIKQYESPTKLNGGGTTYNYYFNRSASKDLKDINKLINRNGKRTLESYEVDAQNKRSPANKKVATLLEERRGQSIDTE